MTLVTRGSERRVNSGEQRALRAGNYEKIRWLKDSQIMEPGGIENRTRWLGWERERDWGERGFTGNTAAQRLNTSDDKIEDYEQP